MSDTRPGWDRNVFYPGTVTWAFGAQACALEVDVQTGVVRLLRYVAVHDYGRPLNPMIVEGQLHGGIVPRASGARCWKRWSTTRPASFSPAR